MIKYAILLLNFTGILLYNAFFAPDVTVTPNAPQQVEPGQEFNFEVSIKKGSTAGFAQLKMELPVGFTATATSKAGGDFKISGEIVRLTWTSLPSDEELKVAFKLTPPQGTKGKVTITAKFSYLVENNKTFAEMPPVEIMVGKEEVVVNTPPPTPEPTTTTAPEPQPTTTTSNTPPPDPEPTTTTTPDPPPSNPETLKTAPAPVVVSAVRKVPAEVKAGEEFTVEVSISKGALKGFARFQDVIPDGLTASAGESKGGSFSFLDQKVKIVWENVPVEENFTITYKVKSEPTSSATLSFEGVFSYVENDEPKKVIIPPTTITIIRDLAVTTPPDNTTTTPPDNTTATTPPNNTTTTPPVPDPPPTNSNVGYKVQICALRSTPVDNTYFQNRYGITDNINLESHEGWNKLTVGKFGTYKQARDHRNQIRNKGVSDAFVTAYNSGTRITVQEALMITKQQWYQ